MMIDFERHCWKCFKTDPLVHGMGDGFLRLCKGCAYELKAYSNFLDAHGFIIVMKLPEEGKEEVVKGKDASKNGQPKVTIEEPV